MKDELIALLETFGYPVFLQGSLTEDTPYPSSFFTFWNNQVSDGSHYDNEPINFIWDFTVYFYSADPDLVNTVLIQVRTLLRQNGWLVSGKGYDVRSDEETHTGRAIDVKFIEH